MIFNWRYAREHSCLSAQALPLVLSRIPAGIVSPWAFLSNVGCWVRSHMYQMEKYIHASGNLAKMY
jgi:hypothetical protein